MQEPLRNALVARRNAIHSRWAALLHSHRANTALANPDTLVFMIEWTLDEIFSGLRRPPEQPAVAPVECSCGLNPLLHFFAVAEQALTESLAQVLASARELSAGDREAALQELRGALAQVRRREVESFCAVCRHRPAEPLPAAEQLHHAS